MLRTYGRRTSRRRSGVHSQSREHEPGDSLLSDPSLPRKRHKVFVEIVSPKRKKSHSNAQAQDQASMSPEGCGRKAVETGSAPAFPGRASGSPVTPERSHTTPPRRPHSSTQPKRGVIQRMLGRSRTESSLEATPWSETKYVATSMVRKASSHSLPTTFPERETTPDDSLQPSPTPLPIRSIRTYAGSSRSFLVALPVPDTPLNPVTDESQPHESYTDLRTRWRIDVSEDDPLPTGMTDDLKSITELRSKGENRRFLDEVGYLFEGLDDSSPVSLRRASALEIASKLCDPDFNRRAKTSDFYIRTWEKLWVARAGMSDKIFDATITFFAALAARDPHTLMEVAQQEEFVPTLVEILVSFDCRKDVLALALGSNSDDDLKMHGILRTEYTALKSLAKLVIKEFSVSQSSARFFVTHALATLPSSSLEDQHLQKLCVSFRSELSLLEPRITAYESGIPLLPPVGINRSEIPSLYHIEACLRLLDSYLLGHWSSAAGPTTFTHVDSFTSELMALCITSSSLLEEGEEELNIARKCLCGAMRVLTLLSHDDPWWCGAALEVSNALSFTTMVAMRSQARWSESRNTESQDSSVEAFDLLCLALGLVMNWATLSPDAIVLSRNNSINPECRGSRPCVRTCRCSDQKSLLECFTMLHAEYSDSHQDDTPERAFLRGYTAILLGLLMKDDSNQSIVMSTLPGVSPSDKIRCLISDCHSFLDFYSDTTPLPLSDSPPNTPEPTPHEPSGRHKATWDKKGEQVARRVIASLEILCDS